MDGVLELGQSEIEDCDAPLLGHEQVLWLEIPVDDSLLVRGR